MQFGRKQQVMVTFCCFFEQNYELFLLLLFLGYNWYNCPLGCVPGQTLSPVVFDLPDPVFNDNVTLRRDGEERDVGSKGGDGEGESVIEMDLSITQEEDITVSTDRDIGFEDNPILINKTLTTEQIKYLKETITLY